MPTKTIALQEVRTTLQTDLLSFRERLAAAWEFLRGRPVHLKTHTQLTYQEPEQGPTITEAELHGPKPVTLGVAKEQ